jgi:membrane protease YdiL (CAAX protease family)
MRSRLGHFASTQKGWQPWGVVVPIIGLGFVAGTVVSITALLQHLGLVDPEENPVGLSGFMAFLFLPFAALGAVVMAWVLLVERRRLVSIGLGGEHRWRLFFGGLLIAVSMVTMIVTGIYLTGGCRIVEFANPFDSLVGLGSVAALLAGFILQSSVEKLFFRGWMLSAIVTKLGLGWGIVLSSLAFMVMHFDPRGTYLFKANVFLFAVFACCWVIRTGNVWGVMGVA